MNNKKKFLSKKKTIKKKLDKTTLLLEVEMDGDMLIDANCTINGKPIVLVALIASILSEKEHPLSRIIRAAFAQNISDKLDPEFHRGHGCELDPEKNPKKVNFKFKKKTSKKSK